MKKLIIILLLIPFTLNAQMSESYAFKQDKQLHTIVGIGSSALVFSLVNRKTNDIDLSFRAAWMSSAFLALGKEMYDCSQGREVSLSDMTYTIGSGLLTAYVFKCVKKHRRKKKLKRLNEFWDLENEYIH